MVKLDGETFEALRSECEALKHRQAAMESDIARVESLKEKIAALAWENDSLREKAATYRLQLDRYQTLAMAVQRGHLAWKPTREARQFKLEEGENMRWLHIADTLAEDEAEEVRTSPVIKVTAK
jgi:hypothetical protein